MWDICGIYVGLFGIYLGYIWDIRGIIWDVSGMYLGYICGIHMGYIRDMTVNTTDPFDRVIRHVS